MLGVLVAAGVVWLAPGLLEPSPPVVELRSAAPANPAAGLGVGPVSYADAVDQAAPAVVNIYIARQVAELPPLRQSPDSLFDIPQRLPRRQEASLGSGVIFSPEGYVLTNNHVVEGAQEIQVMLSDGRTARAQTVGRDPETDLAVLRIDAGELPAVTVAAEDVRVGDVVLAIGNPFGVGQTVTQGIVSATGRHDMDVATFENFIQTDAAINPGNSGGALINARGELVGINTAIYSQSGSSVGIGFAIPVDVARDVLTGIIEQGRVIRGWIGVNIRDLNPELADTLNVGDPRGVAITRVLEGTPAARAGVRAGDVIHQVNDTPVDNSRELLNRVAAVAPGQPVTLRGVRQGVPLEARVVVGERPPPYLLPGG